MPIRFLIPVAASLTVLLFSGGWILATQIVQPEIKTIHRTRTVTKTKKINVPGPTTTLYAAPETVVVTETVTEKVPVVTVTLFGSESSGKHLGQLKHKGRNNDSE